METHTALDNQASLAARSLPPLPPCSRAQEEWLLEASPMMANNRHSTRVQRDGRLEDVSGQVYLTPELNLAELTAAPEALFELVDMVRCAPPRRSHCLQLDIFREWCENELVACQTSPPSSL
jgi:hypothetical protein